MSNLSRPVDGTALPSPRSFRDWMGGGRELTMAEIAISRLSEDEHSIQLRRAVVASTIGTAIEWYDFFLYSTVTGLVFAKLFFPQSDPPVTKHRSRRCCNWHAKSLGPSTSSRQTPACRRTHPT